MTKLLLSIHVLAAIVAIGPVTVAASMFPAATRRALADPSDPRGVAVLKNLHRICRVYAALGVLVPVFGLATANSLDVLGDAWLITSIVLTAGAAAVLALLVLPGQATILTTFAGGREGPAGQPSQADRRTAGATADHTPEPAASAGTTAEGHGADRRSRSAMHPTAAEAGGSPDRAIPGGRLVGRLGMVTGTFNLLWAVVVVLMIVRPGSTTGA